MDSEEIEELGIVDILQVVALACLTLGGTIDNPAISVL